MTLTQDEIDELIRGGDPKEIKHEKTEEKKISSAGQSSIDVIKKEDGKNETIVKYYGNNYVIIDIIRVKMKSNSFLVREADEDKEIIRQRPRGDKKLLLPSLKNYQVVIIPREFEWREAKDYFSRFFSIRDRDKEKGFIILQEIEEEFRGKDSAEEVKFAEFKIIDEEKPGKVEKGKIDPEVAKRQIEELEKKRKKENGEYKPNFTIIDDKEAFGKEEEESKKIPWYKKRKKFLWCLGIIIFFFVILFFWSRPSPKREAKPSATTEVVPNPQPPQPIFQNAKDVDFAKVLQGETLRFFLAPGDSTPVINLVGSEGKYASRFYHDKTIIFYHNDKIDTLFPNKPVIFQGENNVKEETIRFKALSGTTRITLWAFPAINI